MEMMEFAEKVCAALKKELSADYKLTVREVRKNNGVILHGLIAKKRDQNVAPTIYLDSFLEAYESGIAFDFIFKRLLDICHENELKEPVDIEFFRHFEKVRDRICYFLIRRKGNEELLEDIPYVEFLDLAVCFYYAFHEDTLGDGTITIYNSHMELWETGINELFELAKRNTPRLFPWKCRPLKEVQEGMADWEVEAIPDMAGFCLDEMPEKVLSNESGAYGAICILYPDVLENIAKKERRNLYVIPSSVHEVIIVPDTGDMDPEELKNVIAEVNRTQVAWEEVLSDSLYYYDRSRKRIRIV